MAVASVVRNDYAKLVRDIGFQPLERLAVHPTVGGSR
jgi:hypothetical protein